MRKFDNCYLSINLCQRGRIRVQCQRSWSDASHRAETAYPRLKNYVTSRELTEVYTPTQQELALANQHTKKGATKLGFLVLLKTFQRLGYFVASNSVPNVIVSHIIQCAQLSVLPSCLSSYEQSKTRKRHITLIREFLSIKPYGIEARKIVVRSMGLAARTKNDLADIINVAIEELVHHRYELPVFNTLVRAGKRVRGTVKRAFYRQVRQQLNSESCRNLDSLFIIGESASKTPCHELKQDPGKPILKNLKALVWRLKQKIHVKAKEALDKYREEYQARTDRSIGTFRDVIVAYSTEGEVTQRFSEIEKVLGENPDQLFTECEAPKSLHWKQLLPLSLAFLSFPPSYTVPDSQTG